MKKILFVIFFPFFMILPFSASAQENIEVNFFYSPTCPHCAEEKTFLDELSKNYPRIEINKFDINKNADLLNNFYDNYNVPEEKQGFVPVTFIKDKYYLGFNEKMGEDIKNYLSELSENSQPTVASEPQNTEKNLVTLPIIGEVDLSNYSLSALAVIFGFFDGFNVCSLGALVLILGLVLVFRSRIKILILGGIFILTTGIIYGFLIFLWHQLFVALAPYIRKMEIVVGILAVIGAVYFIREFYSYIRYGPICKFGGITNKLSLKLQNVFEKGGGILILASVVFLFAAAVTIIEFPCSAVLPVLFAGVLTKSQVAFPLSIIYIVIFLFFYMLDEIIIFLVSVFTLKIWLVSPKFAAYLNLIAGLLLLFLGFYYIFGLIS